MSAHGATGAELYAKNCAICHGAGPGHPGTQALQIKYGGQPPALLTERRDLNPAMLRAFVRNGVGAMPFFRKTELTDAQLEALSKYLVQHR